MKNLILNAILIGGIMPMIFFGTTNFLQKFTSQKLSPSGWVIGLAIGGCLLALIYSFVFDKGEVVKEFTRKEFYIALVSGLLWGGAAIGLGIAYTKFNANASQIVPIVMANMIVTVILSILILHEPVIIWKIVTGTLLIFIGTLFLVK